VVGCGRPRGGGTDLGHERGLPGQPGLARPAGAGERDEARGAQERADALDVGGAPHEARQPGGAGGGERRAQHRHPGFGQLGAGVDAQLLGQQRDRAVEGGERIGLAARGVQRTAEQRRRGLAQRRGGELGGERVDVGREAQPQRQPGALVDGVGAAPVEPGRRRAREGQLDDVGQRGPAPERQRVAEEAVRLRRARRPRLGDQRVERHRVDRAGLDRQPVAAGLGDHQLAQRPAQPRDQRLQGVGRVLRWGLPQPVDERSGADRPPGVEREPGQQPAQAHAGQAVRPVDGAQHADPHGHQCAGTGHALSRWNVRTPQATVSAATPTATASPSPTVPLTTAPWNAARSASTT
jgi:hypothetical protein